MAPLSCSYLLLLQCHAMSKTLLVADVAGTLLRSFTPRTASYWDPADSFDLHDLLCLIKCPSSFNLLLVEFDKLVSADCRHMLALQRGWQASLALGKDESECNWPFLMVWIMALIMDLHCIA